MHFLMGSYIFATLLQLLSGIIYFAVDISLLRFAIKLHQTQHRKWLIPMITSTTLALIYIMLVDSRLFGLHFNRAMQSMFVVLLSLASIAGICGIVQFLGVMRQTFQTELAYQSLSKSNAQSEAVWPPAPTTTKEIQ
jgi:hypothetical protein